MPTILSTVFSKSNSHLPGGAFPVYQSYLAIFKHYLNNTYQHRSLTFLILAEYQQMDKPLPSERYLLEQVAQGNEISFRTLFEHYSGNIYASALTFTKSPDAAKEMVQEVFLKVWLKREALLSIESFDDYIFIIARNIIFNYFRKQKRTETFKQHLQRYFEDIKESPEDLLIQKQNEALLHQAIEQLPAQQRNIYTLRRIQGLSIEEIANTLGLSKNTIRNHINAALHAIQSYLTDHSDKLLWVFFFPGLLVF